MGEFYYGTVIGAMTVVVITVVLLDVYGISTKYLDYAMEDNMTIRQIYFETRPDEYKMRYDDWKSIPERGQK